MYFQRFYDMPLAEASYLIGCQATGEAIVIDVRSQSEWEAGHLPGTHHRQLGTLEARLNEVPRDGLVVVHCQGGTRSSIAASLLAAHGFRNVINLQGGYQEWTAAGYPVIRDGAPQ